MNETEIAKQVAQNIPKPEPTDSTPVPEVTGPSAFETNIELNDPAIGLQLTDFFGLTRAERFSEETQRQLRDIYRWAAEKAGTTDLDKVMYQIQALENELGITFKPNKLTTINRWVKLYRQSEVIRMEMGSLYGL